MPYPQGITNRLPAAHPGINGVRKTLHTAQADVPGTPRTTTNVTTPTRRHQTIRHVLHGLAPIAALVAVLVVAAPAAAAPSCARQVIDDWYDDGRVDRTYPLHCYDDAINALPPDVRDYSSAKEDIQRALQARMRNEPAPAATKDPSPGGSGGTTTTPTKPPKNQTTTDVSNPKNENPPEASGQVDSDSASSVPIPLLVLAGLALLLIAGGSAGYLVRRYQGRNNPPPAV